MKKRLSTSRWCQRTWIAMSPVEIEAHGQRDAEAIGEMLSPSLTVYPTPSAENCTHCVFRAPCMIMSRGDGPGPVLAERYRERTSDLADLKGWPNREPRHSEGHLGRWSAW